MAIAMQLDTIKHAYCIGIGGIGVSAAAKYLHLSGVQVSGSDAMDSDSIRDLRHLGITTFIGADAGNLPDAIDLLIYSPAVPYEHVERVAARQRTIPEVSYPEFLSLLAQKKYTIAITGTHGKSTTTAMVGLLLKAAGFDPTVIVGSRCASFSHGNLNMGTSNIFVVEACEYQGNMRLLHPDIAVVTNVEWDHPDFYKNQDDVYRVMQEFVDGMHADGLLVKNYDDRLVRGKLNWGGRTTLFGLDESADFAATNLIVQNGASYFTVPLRSKVGFVDERFSVRVPGKFNVSNALAAMAVAWEMRVPVDIIRNTLASFTGIWRRFERVGVYKEATVISDYAHHPTAVDATIRAARAWFPGGRIVVAYQPHQHARTKELFKEFITAFNGADLVLLSDIYDVHGREESTYQDVTSAALVEAITHTNKKLEIEYAGDLRALEKRVKKMVRPGDILLVMGAGDIDTVARRLTKK